MIRLCFTIYVAYMRTLTSLGFWLCRLNLIKLIFEVGNTVVYNFDQGDSLLFALFICDSNLNHGSRVFCLAFSRFVCFGY